MLHIVTLLEPFVLGICYILYNKQTCRLRVCETSVSGSDDIGIFESMRL